MAKLRFNTSFMLKAMAVCAVACLPMALFGPDGLYFSAFAVPLSISTRVTCEGEYRFALERVAGSSLQELGVEGGRQTQSFAQARIIFLALMFAFVSFLLLNDEA